MRRRLATGVVGAAVTAGTMIGVGTAAAAEPLVLDTCAGTHESSAFGQPILASPATLDAKVEQAVLLVHPLEFGLAKQAREEFLQTSSVQVGSVTEEEQTFSGPDLADAFASRVAALSAAGDRADEVNTHVRNLAAVGCLGGAGVSGQAEPAPPPSSESAPSTRDQPNTQSPAGQDPEQRNSPASSVQGVARPGGSASYSPYGAAAPVRVLPPDYRSAPASNSPWARTGQLPGLWPDAGHLHQQEAAKKRAEAQVRAVGKAEALPADASNRVELPVLLAAISLAAVTSGLVRTWVLRRN